MRSFFASTLEIAEVALVAIGAVWLIRFFLVQPFLVSGSSMVPTFQNGDYLLVDELTYRFREPARGEVVVFRFPKDHSRFFIKRVIGLPGERVVIENNRIILFREGVPEGELLSEEYLGGAITPGAGMDVALGANEYFVLGDNRSFSFDSRSWGSLERQDIVGVVRLRLWPFYEFRAFAAPEY